MGMTTTNAQGIGTFRATATAIAQGVRVALDANGLVSAASDSVAGIGVTEQAVAASGYVAVKLWNANGTFNVLAAGEVSIGETVTAAAAGTVSTGGSVSIGTALSQGALGSYVEIAPAIGAAGGSGDVEVQASEDWPPTWTPSTSSAMHYTTTPPIKVAAWTGTEWFPVIGSWLLAIMLTVSGLGATVAGMQYNFFTTNSFSDGLSLEFAAVDPRFYGAVADDDADDFEAFYDALLAANMQGRRLYVPSGTWNFTGDTDVLELSVPIVVFGDGGTSIIKHSGHDAALANAVFSVTASTNVVIRDLAVSDVRYGVYLQDPLPVGGHVTVENLTTIRTQHAVYGSHTVTGSQQVAGALTVDALHFYGAGATNAVGISLQNTPFQRVDISRSQFYNGLYGVSVTLASVRKTAPYVSISDVSPRVTIKECHFSLQAHDVSNHGAINSSVADTHVEDCTFGPGAQTVSTATTQYAINLTGGGTVNGCRFWKWGNTTDVPVAIRVAGAPVQVDQTGYYVPTVITLDGGGTSGYTDGTATMTMADGSQISVIITTSGGVIQTIAYASGQAWTQDTSVRSVIKGGGTTATAHVSTYAAQNATGVPTSSIEAAGWGVKISNNSFIGTPGEVISGGCVRVESDVCDITGNKVDGFFNSTASLFSVVPTSTSPHRLGLIRCNGNNVARSMCAYVFRVSTSSASSIPQLGIDFCENDIGSLWGTQTTYGFDRLEPTWGVRVIGNKAWASPALTLTRLATSASTRYHTGVTFSDNLLTNISGGLIFSAGTAGNEGSVTNLTVTRNTFTAVVTPFYIPNYVRVVNGVVANNYTVGETYAIPRLGTTGVDLQSMRIYGNTQAANTSYETPFLGRQADAPTVGIVPGAFWIDSDDESVKIWNGSAWRVITTAP